MKYLLATEIQYDIKHSLRNHGDLFNGHCNNFVETVTFNHNICKENNQLEMLYAYFQFGLYNPALKEGICYIYNNKRKSQQETGELLSKMMNL